MKTKWLLLCGLLAGTTLFAQQVVLQESQAELTTPGGTVNGRLVIQGNQLAFLSDSAPSIAIPKENIEGLTIDGNTITVRLRNPIRENNSDQNRLVLRMSDLKAGQTAVSWYNGAAVTAGPGQVIVGQGPSYEAKHNGSHGRLVVTSTGLDYEAVDNAKDSRRWEFQNIKELKLENGEHTLKIEPFHGDDSHIDLPQGLSKADYQQMVDMVARARAGR